MASKTRSKATNKKPTAARAKAHDRRLLAKAAREAEANEIIDRFKNARDPKPFRITGPAFNGGEELRPDCMAADLFSLVFDSPNADPDNLLEQALGCLCDDLELICAAAASTSCLDEVIERVANRNHYRVKVAIEVNRRMAAARLPEEAP